MATAWAHLPNAALIDQVLGDITKIPYAAWDAAWDTAQGAARIVVRAAARDAAWAASRTRPQYAARYTAWAATANAVQNVIMGYVGGTNWRASHYAARPASWDVARYAAEGAVRALIAWDKSRQLFDMPLGGVRLMVSNGNHAAVLIYPYLKARHEFQTSDPLSTSHGLAEPQGVGQA